MQLHGWKFFVEGLKQASKSDNNNPNGESSDRALRTATSHQSKKHCSRVGGRKARRQTTKQKRSPDLVLPRIPTSLIEPLFILFIIVSFIAIFDENPSSYVHYQSIVYESTVIVGPDGRTETYRTESIKSNSPDFVRRQRAIAGEQDGSSTILRERDLDENAEKLFNRQLDSVIKEQQRLRILDEPLIPYW